MRFSRAGVTAALMVFCAAQAQAFTPNKTPLTSSEKAIESLGTGIAIALPLAAGGIAYYKKDDTGIAQLLVESVLTVGTVFALKQVVREQRPDGSDYHSFPSETTAAAASGSAFLWRRYGWEYGLPASVLTQFVSYSRVQAHQHRWYDTLASSGIAAGYAWAVGTPFKRRYNLETSIEPAADGGMIHLSYNW
ncbi:MAG TPA: phosphatase PAP2 family protein [Rhizomicrobium sp.]|nr:phosphatase PAP2 family protein [Rhizomicrobium sp.]